MYLRRSQPAMKHTLLTTVFFIGTIALQAQTCPGCSIDYSYTSPGLYPEILPPATAGEYYEVDLTFLLQEDTTVEVLGSDVTFAFLNYHILEPIGLPYGIHVTSNLGDFPVDYDPADGLFGCARVCGTPLVAGSYTITVPLIATLEDPAGDNPAEYELSLEVLPPSATDGGIVASTTFGCSPLTVDLSTGHPSDGAEGFSYTWDFGDGTYSILEDPVSVTLTADGTEPVEYVVTHTVTIDTIGYNLDYVTVLSTGCDDCAFFGCTGLFAEENPDIYLYFPELGITTDYYLDTNPPVTFSLNTALDPAATYNMQVKDDDDGGFGADDNCGNLMFSGDDVGVFTYDIGSSDVEISISHPIIFYTYTDTIVVYPVPSIPELTISGETELCEGDSVLLSTTPDPTVTYQWLQDGDPIPSAFDADFYAMETGTYALQATATGGCTAISESVDVVVYELPFPPFVSIIGNTLQTSSDYPIQWYYSGDPIPGANDSIYEPAIEGIYQAAAINGPCISFSSEIDFVFQSVLDLDPFQLTIAPNPVDDMLFLSGNTAVAGTMTIQIINATGQVIRSKTLSVGSVFSLQLPMDEIPSGYYRLIMRSAEQQGSYPFLRQ